MNVRLSKPLITDHIKTYPTLKDNNDQLFFTHFQSTLTYYYSSSRKFIVFSDGTESSNST